jgi:hypothetical protein
MNSNPVNQHIKPIPKSIGVDARSVEPFLEQITMVQFCGDTHRSVTGRIEEIHDSYIVLRHRDGRRTLARLDEIASISELTVRRP